MAKNDSMMVNITGIKEVQSALSKIDDDLKGEFKKGFKKIAESVVSDTQIKVPYLTGRAAGSLKSRSSNRGASIAFGGTAAPYYPWLDFGGKVGRGKSISRPFIRKGRYLYPTIAEHSDDIREQTENMVERVSRSAGFTVKG